MIKAPLIDATGATRGEVDLPEQIFGVVPNTAVVHEVLAWQLAAVLARLGVGEEKVILVTAAHNQTLVKAADNLRGVTVLTARTLNVHDLLAHPRLVVTREALGVVREVWGDDR